MPLERDNDAERRERLKVLLKEAENLRRRAQQATQRAQELISHSQEIWAREERRQHREALLKGATETLKAAKACDPVVLRFRERRKKTG